MVPDYCKLFTNPKESIATIYQAGLSPTSVMHRISAIKDIFMKDQTLGEKAWEVYLEHNLSTKLAKYYEISTNSWNKLLLGLTEKLQPMFSKAAWAVIISKMLENRLPMGIIAGENGNSYFTDYLQVSNQDSRLPKYIEEGPKVTLYNDVLADKNEAYTYANGVYGKNELERVGYYILMPKLEQPKGLVIRVYGGRQKSDAQTSKYTGTPDAFSKKLLGQGYAIAYLNLADLHFNNAFQAQMPENIFDSVLEGINLFINAVKTKKISDDIIGYGGEKPGIAAILADCPIFLEGESFGGVTVTGFMRKYPGVIAGGISWNGGLCYEAQGAKCADYLEPGTIEHIKLLKEPLLVLQAWNDNCVIPGELNLFLERAKQAGKKGLIHPFMLKMANEKVSSKDKQTYIGHFLDPANSQDLDRVVQQVLKFLENPKNPSLSDQAIDTRRANIIKSYAPLNSKKQSFEELFKGTLRKWYEERLYSISNQDFEKEWAEYYLPQYVTLIGQLATDAFELKVDDLVKKEAADRVQDLNCFEITVQQEILWSEQIKQLLKQQLRPVGLSDFVTTKHIAEVKDSIGGYKKRITKNFAARIALQALANVYVSNFESQKYLKESRRLNHVKAQVRGWIEGWRADSRDVWHKTFVGLKQEKDKVSKKLTKQKNIYSAKQLLAYYLGDEMFDKPWLHLKLAEKFACLNPKVMELAENLLPKIFKGLVLPIENEKEIQGLLNILDYLSKIPLDQHENFKNILNGILPEQKTALTDIVIQRATEKYPEAFANFTSNDNAKQSQVTLEERAKIIKTVSSALAEETHDKAWLHIDFVEKAFNDTDKINEFNQMDSIDKCLAKNKIIRGNTNLDFAKSLLPKILSGLEFPLETANELETFQKILIFLSKIDEETQEKIKQILNGSALSKQECDAEMKKESVWDAPKSGTLAESIKNNLIGRYIPNFVPFIWGTKAAQAEISLRARKCILDAIESAVVYDGQDFDYE